MRADALWADFLSGTDPLPTKKPTEPKIVSSISGTPAREVKPEPPKKTVTQIFDFAGALRLLFRN